MGVLSDCHVQVKRILPDDDFVKPQKEGFLTGVGDGDGVLSGRSVRIITLSILVFCITPSFVKISNVQHFTVMNDYPQQTRKLRGINHLIPAEVLP